MINRDKWIGSLPNINLGSNDTKNQIDHEKWVNTIHKENNKGTMKKYSFVSILFLCGLLLVSALKNETRNLQKEINDLQTSINVIRFNLDQAILDNEVLTSPENISLLAKEYLDTDLESYKRSQIEQLSDKSNIGKKKVKKIPKNVESKLFEKIEKKKVEIKKLQELYKNPKLIPNQVRLKVKKTIEKKKSELESIYNEPKKAITFERVGKWGAIQVAKLFLGIPVIPGK